MLCSRLYRLQAGQQSPGEPLTQYLPGSSRDLLQPSLYPLHHRQLAELQEICKRDQSGQRVSQPTQLYLVPCLAVAQVPFAGLQVAAWLAGARYEDPAVSHNYLLLC